jgi:hypothetical protein
MSMIIAGHFERQGQADEAVRTLLSGGIEAERIIKADHMDGLFTLKAGPKGASGAEDTAVSGPAGYLVAVDTPVEAERAFAAGVMRQHGASDVEETERHLRDGKWVELDLAVEPPPVVKSFW